MRNPYEVLGVPSNASINEVKEAYKSLAKMYYGYDDEYSKEKLRELDEAYDAIINKTGFGYDGVLKEIRLHIRNGNTDRAEELLLTVPNEGRTAEWYFLSGNINSKKGYFEKASQDFATANNMEPDNPILNPIRERMVDTAKHFAEPKLSFPSDKPEIKIDYIFVSPDVQVIDADIPAIVAADHRPHTATVKL